VSATLKISLLLASYAIIWLQIHLDYKKQWSDKRTRLHRRAFLLIKFVLVPIAVLSSLVTAFLDDADASASKAQHAAMKQTLDEIASAVGVEAPAEITKAVEDLKGRVAIQQSDLAAAQKTIQDLQTKTEKAALGIYKKFDFNGARRSARPGYMSVEDGPEMTVFAKMVELHSANRWADLRDLTTRQTLVTPDWLTPFLFLGVAQANLGEKKEALRLFRYVDEKALGDPAYAEAAQFEQRLLTTR
jgi:hypothetical protein